MLLADEMIVCDDEARWSSGQDGGLSRRNQEFDSPTGHHYLNMV